ncbi:hypothetical protein H5410_053886, partial [Solanum commersonii]
MHRNLLSGSCGFEPRYFRGLSTPFSLSLTRLASCFNLQNQCFDDDGEGDGCDYGYSRLIVFLEKLSTPLRLWIGGYALQCLLHVCFIWVEFQRSFDDFAGGNFDGVSSFSLLHSSKILQSVNTAISSIWWVFGFYWIVMGGQELLQDSPCLY